MGFLSLFICLFSTMILVARAEGDQSQFEAKVIAQLGELAQKNSLVIAELGELAQKNEELVQKNEELEKELEYLKKELSNLESERTYEAFDCYRTESWYDTGIIPFMGCSGMCFVSIVY